MTHTRVPTYLFALIAIIFVASASETTLNSVLRNPRAYHRHRVSVIGVARVQGESFVLYASDHDATTFAKPSRAISVAQRIDGPRLDQLDRR